MAGMFHDEDPVKGLNTDLGMVLGENNIKGLRNYFVMGQIEDHIMHGTGRRSCHGTAVY